MTVSIFTDFGQQFTNQIGSFASNVSESLIGTLGPILSIALTCYFIWKAWTILFGQGQGSIGALVLQVTKIALVAYFALNAGNYAHFVIDAVYRLENMMIELISSTIGENNINSAWSSIDALWEMFADSISNFNSILGETSWITKTQVCVQLILIILIMGILSVFFTFAAVATLLINQTLLIVVLGFGPLFICMLMFPSTRGFFDGWLKSCLTYVFTLVIVSAVISLFGMTFQTCIVKMQSLVVDNTVAIGELLLPFLNFCVLSLTAATLVRLIPSVTAGLVGGVSLQAVGVGQMLGGASRTGAAIIGAGAMGAGGALSTLTGSSTAARLQAWGSGLYQRAGGSYSNPGAFGVAAMGATAGSMGALAHGFYREDVGPLISNVARVARTLSHANSSVDSSSGATSSTPSAGSVSSEFGYTGFSHTATGSTGTTNFNSADMVQATGQAAAGAADLARNEAQISKSMADFASKTEQAGSQEAANIDFARRHYQNNDQGEKA